MREDARWQRRSAERIDAAMMDAPRRSLASDANVDMTLFAEYDRDGDRRLAFAEFL